MDTINEKTVAIVPAAGVGRRMGHDVPKQFLSLGNKPIFIYTLKTLDLCPSVDGVILVMTASHVEQAGQLIKDWQIRKTIQIISGGKERQDSVRNGLEAVPADTTIVLVHDGVRPFASVQNIEDVIRDVRTYGAAILGVPTKNTIKKIDNGWVKETLNRDLLWQIQTPQGFRLDWLQKAYTKAFTDGYYMTDDAALVERLGHRVRIVEGEGKNIKITSHEDLILAEAYLVEESE